MTKKTVTPWGRFRFAYLTPGKPDNYEGASRYKADLLVEDGQEDALAALEATCEQALDEWLQSPEGRKKAGKNCKRKALAREDEDGTKVLRVSMNSSYSRNGVSVPMKPARFDGAKRPIADDVEVGSGSRGRFAVDLVPWAMRGECGVKLRLSAVQVTEIQSFTDGADMFDSVTDDSTDASDSFDE